MLRARTDCTNPRTVFFVISLVLWVCLAFFGMAGVSTARDTHDKTSGAAVREHISDGGLPGTGYRPPPVDLSHLETRAVARLLSAPPRFDWRETGKVSPVKNQGTCGSCYAFAGIANLESRILIQGDSLFDFSENNVKECEWFTASCGGGNDWMVANFLTTAGTVMEACDPYVAGDVSCNLSCQYRKTLLDWRVICGEQPAPVDVLKSYIMAYGPVYSTLYVGNANPWRAEFGAYDGSYVLYHESNEAPNHAVLIIGWDDDLQHAGGTGAWIVKNSWGTSWGGTCGFGTERGYFKIAYGSAKIGANSSFAFEVTDYSPTDTLLYHDEGGFGGCTGIMNKRTVWGLCRFVPSRAVEAKRVEFWAPDATTDVDIYIYDDFDGSTPSRLLAAAPDNAFDMAGYHSVPLAWPTRVEAGEDLYVAMKITTAVSKFPLVYDCNGPRTPGVCYMSSDGVSFNEFVYGDLGIRLRASTDLTCPGAGEAPLITGVSDLPDDGGGYVSLTWIRNATDTGGPGATRFYRIWRRRKEALAPLLQTAGFDGPETAGPYQHGIEGPAWEVIGTVDATERCSYQFTAPTHCDRTPADSCWDYFCVTAHTGLLGEHFDSPVMPGFSINNQDTFAQPGGGSVTSSQPEEPIPAHLFLKSPSPNPTAGGFTVEFSLPRAEWVKLSLHDVRGREVAVILDEARGAGSHVIAWEPDAHRTGATPSGIYFLRLATPPEARTARLVFVR
jgi:C1A family cysteine protease